MSPPPDAKGAGGAATPSTPKRDSNGNPNSPRKYILHPYSGNSKGGGQCAQAHAPACVFPETGREADRGTACPCAISLPKPKKAKPEPILTLWLGGSRADIPSVRHLNPKAYISPPPPTSARGLVTEFSDKSRRRFFRKLSALRIDAICYTMALTLPGEFEQFSPEFLQLAHKKLGERFSKRCSMHTHWESLALAWKKEPQKRGALHWHLLFFGVDENQELGQEVQSWIAHQWNELICSNLDPGERAKHLRWHQDSRNWQHVQRLQYFTKYVGKVHDLQNQEGSTGRWWGFWRKSKLPWAVEQSAIIPDEVAVDLNRVGRKIRRIRANAAKHAAVIAKMDPHISPFSDYQNGRPRPLTPWDIYRLKAGYGPKGKDDFQSKRHKKLLPILQKEAGVRFGKYKFKTKGNQPNPDELKITLTGHAIPEAFERLALWSIERHGKSIQAASDAEIWKSKD